MQPSSRGMRAAGAVALVVYIATIFSANWAIARFGPIPVGFGLKAPAGVYVVGLAFTFRDIVQDTLGRLAVVAAIILGAACSALVSPQFAFASAVAFLLSEAADFAVYTPIRERNWLAAIALSNTVGLAFDSVLFLWLAFHSLAFLPGQIVGKGWMTLVAVVLLVPWRRRFAQPRGASS